MSEVIRRIRDRAARHPELLVTEAPGWIEIRPPGVGSFAIVLVDHATSYTVYFEGFLKRAEPIRDGATRFRVGCEIRPDVDWEQYRDLA